MGARIYIYLEYIFYEHKGARIYIVHRTYTGTICGRYDGTLTSAF